MCKHYHRHSEEFHLRNIHGLSPACQMQFYTLITWGFIVILSILCWITQWKLICFRTDWFFFFPVQHEFAMHPQSQWCLMPQTSAILGWHFFFFFCMEMLQSVSMFTWWWLLRFFHHPHCWLLTNTALGWTLCTRIWKHIGFCFPWTISRRMVGL